MDHDYYMEKALAEAELALRAGEFPVGCVLVCDGRIVASGRRSGTRSGMVNEVDHAEMTALRALAEQGNGCDGRLTAYCTMEPCLMCLGALVLGGVVEIVYAYEDVMGGAAACDLKALTPLYKNSGLSVRPHVLREQSLDLFKRFFKRRENSYWRGSLLSEYTLSQ